MKHRNTLFACCLMLLSTTQAQDPNPHCDSTLASQFLVSISGLTVTLTDVSPVGGMTTTISAWGLGDGSATSGGSPFEYTYSAPGTYEICLTTLFCNPNFIDTCFDEHCEMVTVGVAAVPEGPNKRRVSLYPVPASDVLWVSAAAGSRLERVALLDAAGRELRTMTPMTDRATLQTGSLLPGVYLVKVQIEGETMTWPVTVEN